MRRQHVILDDTVQLLDQLQADAWPPAIVERIGTWRLRWAWGLTRRANSVAVLGPPPGPLDRLVERAESFYGTQDLPTVFQVSSHSNECVEAGLADLGYAPSAEVAVEVASVDDVASFTSRDWKIVLHAQPSDAWFGTYWDHELHRWPDAERGARVYRSTFLRTSWPRAFAKAWRDGEVVAVGQGVTNGSWAGVQCLVTAPGLAAPRRGHGGARRHRRVGTHPRCGQRVPGRRRRQRHCSAGLRASGVRRIAPLRVLVAQFVIELRTILVLGWRGDAPPGCRRCPAGTRPRGLWRRQQEF